MKAKTKLTKLWAILLSLVMLLSLLPTTAFAAGSAETTDITEINLTGNYQYGNVSAGILPAFNPGTTTDSITIDKTNSGWEYKMESGGWSGFGLETPVAYNDGKTDYGYCFAVETKTGYQLASDLKVVYNGVDVTSSVKVLKYAWGGYVTVDLGKAIGENPTTHTVTFNSNGGTEIAPKEVVSGAKIKAPSAPTKDKYLFRGWYEDSTFSKEFDFNTPISSDMTLYANWEAANSINEIRLAGDVQYGNVQVGTLPSFNPRTTTDSITIDRTNSNWAYKMQNGLWSRFGLKTPTAVNDGKTYYGYDFCVKTNDGYQLASDLKVIYNGEDVTSTVDIMKTSWGAYVTVDLGKANGTPVVYTITFNSNDGTLVPSQNVNAGEKLTEPTPAPTKVGFTFVGWYEDSTFSKKFDFNTPITDSMTLYAKWTENKYTLTFDANGGSGTMTPKADLTGEYTLPANEFTAPSGKQFKGWSLTTDGAIVTKVAMTENRTVYAIWENIPVVTYTVSFAANGGTGTMADVTGISGEYTLPANGFTAPAGKQFKAWSVGGVEKAVGDKITVTANTTVNAVWEAIEYNVTVTGGTASVGAGTPITKATMGTTVTLTANAAPTDMVFDKWEVISGSITLADANSATTTFTMPAGAVSVKATYTTYITVNLAAGEGSGTMEPIIIKNTYGYFSLTAPECTFTAPANKVFDKWQFSKDDSYLKPGDTKTIWSSADGATLTAIWKDAPVTEYDITVTDGKATVGAGTPITKATMGTTVTLTAGAAPTGKVFDEWKVVSGGITLADANSATTTFTMPASAVSVKATYKNAPHTHTYNQETVKPEALKTPAGCTNNAVYFKSCSCGAISTTDTFVAMNTALGHAYGSDWKYDSTNHWHECSRCHDKKNEAAHDYGSDNVCDTCGYDKTVPHTHNLTLVAAKAATCTIAGNSAYYTCDGCDKWFEDATGSVEITDKTSVKIPAPGHTAGTEWKSDDTNHWHECTVAGCGVIIESTKSAHTAGEWIVDTPATATTAGTKHKECTVCHRVLETQTIPSTGTELKIIAGDNQIYNKASGSDVTITCNGDFAKFTGIKVDGSVVDSSNYTAVSGSTVLTLKASYLGTLTDGSHTITFVYTDGEANANLTVRTAGSGHIHDYGTEWKSNADNHWHECSCGDKKDEAAHSFKWVVDKEATATKKGSKHEECKTCGYKRPAVEIPATGTSTAPTDTTKPNDTTKPGNTNGSEKSPQTGDNSNIFLWFALLFVSAAGVTGITAYNKKKKEHAE